ncbi:MAG: S8 family serine peptidase, partial [Burkholderiaceae bacterium]|nr:S8 family serine peptidase [Burkholderiaceae bacterium]
MAAVAAATLLTGCGGAGSGGADPGALPDQSGCALRYALGASAALTGTDPLLPLQWHLDNVGQTGGTAGEDVRAFAAWTITRGEGARVAIVDDAVELVHEDLAPNVVAGASYSYRPGAIGSHWPLPCAPDDDHGTSVAGIVLARDANAFGGAGVAPRASLVAYNALATSYDADIADALTRAPLENGVYHNSWGSPDDGRLGYSGASFDEAIEAGITNGRGGLGAVYVFPGGNGRCYATDLQDRCYAETTGLDAYLNQRGVIAVCAVDHRGRATPYGERGANLLVCAPSDGGAGTPAITTTAVRNGMRADFSGTSASAPIVSGVAALVLARYPALSWRDLRLILARSARRNDPGHPGWVESPFGPAFNHDYGFGVVDAAAALRLAAT